MAPKQKKRLRASCILATVLTIVSAALVLLNHVAHHSERALTPSTQRSTLPVAAPLPAAHQPEVIPSLLSGALPTVSVERHNPVAERNGGPRGSVSGHISVSLVPPLNPGRVSRATDLVSAIPASSATVIPKQPVLGGKNMETVANRETSVNATGLGARRPYFIHLHKGERTLSCGRSLLFKTTALSACFDTNPWRIWSSQRAGRHCATKPEQ